MVAAAFSPGGQNVATADRAGVVRIWAPESLAADDGRAAVLLTGAPVTALSWDTRADKIMYAPPACPQCALKSQKTLLARHTWSCDTLTPAQRIGRWCPGHDQDGEL